MFKNMMCHEPLKFREILAGAVIPLC